MNRTLRIVAACGLIVALTYAAPAAGQPPQGDAPFFAGAGTELFRGLFDYHGIEPLQSPNDVTEQTARQTIVVVLVRRGDRRRNLSPADVARASATVLRGGGSLLIAIENPGGIGGYFPSESATDVQVSNPVYAPEFALDDDPGRLFVTPRYPTAGQFPGWELNRRPKGTEWALFANRERVAVSDSTALWVKNPSPYVEYSLAGFPEGSRLGFANGIRLDRDRYSFAVGGSGVMPGQPPFRSLVLGDPDVFSNSLIAKSNPAGGPLTDNFAFANAVVQWLRGPENAPRTRCLFVDGDRVVTKFDDVKYVSAAVPGPPPMPPIPDLTSPENQKKLADAANAYLAEQQDADVFNRLLAGTDARYVRTARVLATLAATAALLALLYFAARHRHRPDLPPVPTDTGRVAGSAPPGSVARRREEVLQTGNYAEYVREYLRDLFADRGFPVPHGPAPAALPAVTATGPDAKAVRANLRILWEAAYGASPTPIPYSRWKELEPMIDVVRRAADEGRWRFAAPGGAP